MYNKSLKIKILEEAFNSFLDIIDEYASQHGLSNKDRVLFRRQTFLIFFFSRILHEFSPKE